MLKFYNMFTLSFKEVKLNLQWTPENQAYRSQILVRLEGDPQCEA